MVLPLVLLERGYWNCLQLVETDPLLALDFLRVGGLMDGVYLPLDREGLVIITTDIILKKGFRPKVDRNLQFWGKSHVPTFIRLGP
ncbi:hypothetical protein AVEN_236806-1 [Araneus ventricosus]|uniref:Uncharacterized protein n=1 Tax=Araneus ventricosus TaxID=182803 RepID=A0A4Y2KBE7_ARAVE|nr:hypothetical protein AVEN_236806-1 [Araneus ventricosus]